MGEGIFNRWLSLSLAVGGALALVVHLIVTPLVPSSEGFEVVASSSAFLWRQSLSAVVAAFILLGAAEILCRPAQGAPRWAGPAAALAMLGSAALIAQEWGEIFIVRALALAEPAALVRLDSTPGIDSYDLGAMTALVLFTAGCLALIAAALRTPGATKAGPCLVLAGFFLIPLGAALTHSVLGTIPGDAVMDAGWILWGLDRYRSARAVFNHAHNS
jgi:hypothetical protein